MGVTLFTDGTNQYYRITKRWGDKDHQYYVRVGKSKERALKEALAIEARLEQAARAHASVKALTGENLIHTDGSIVGVALGFRQRSGRTPNIEFKVRVAARGKPVRFSTVSLNKYDFDAAFQRVIETVVAMRDVQKGSEAYSRLLAAKAYYAAQLAAMNKTLRNGKAAKKTASVKRAASEKAPAKPAKKVASAKKTKTVEKSKSAKAKTPAAKPSKNVAKKTTASKPAKKTAVPSVKTVRQQKTKVKPAAEVKPAKVKPAAAQSTVAADLLPPKKAKRKQPAASHAEAVKAKRAVEAAVPAKSVDAPKKASTDDWEEILSKEVQRFMQRKGIVRG